MAHKTEEKRKEQIKEKENIIDGDESDGEDLSDNYSNYITFDNKNSNNINNNLVFNSNNNNGTYGVDAKSGGGFRYNLTQKGKYEIDGSNNSDIQALYNDPEFKELNARYAEESKARTAAILKEPEESESEDLENMESQGLAPSEGKSAELEISENS